jgi:hypothetical protein
LGICTCHSIPSLSTICGGAPLPSRHQCSLQHTLRIQHSQAIGMHAQHWLHIFHTHVRTLSNTPVYVADHAALTLQHTHCYVRGTTATHTDHHWQSSKVSLGISLHTVQSAITHKPASSTCISSDIHGSHTSTCCSRCCLPGKANLCQCSLQW